MEVKNIINDTLLCYACLEEKEQLTAQASEAASVIDMDLRPFIKFIRKEIQWTHEDIPMSGRYPIVAGPDLSYTQEAYEQREIEEDLDIEFKIQSSWYHRARLGDENRVPYTDGKDTDFEAEEEKWKLEHENDSDDDLRDSNGQLVFDQK